MRDFSEPRWHANCVKRLNPNALPRLTRNIMNERISAYSMTEHQPLQATPIPPQWVRVGEPVATSTVLWRSDDGACATILWECTAGVFDWHYDTEETVHIVGGAVEVMRDDGSTLSLKSGDTAIFRKGAHAVWTVHESVRKVAIFRNDMPAAIALGLRIVRKLSRIGREALRAISRRRPSDGNRPPAENAVPIPSQIQTSS
jgi:uncharacterized protein